MIKRIVVSTIGVAILANIIKLFYKYDLISVYIGIGLLSITILGLQCWDKIKK